jgi:hypothetical protein
MSNFSRILIHGGALSLLSSLYLLAVLYYNPRLFLQDYPDEVQARVPPKTAQERRQSLLVGVPFLLLLIAVPTLSTLALKNQAGGATFWQLFLNAFGVVFSFNLVDWLLLDWLIICTLKPRFLIIPGTEGMDSYEDYAYHFRGFLIGTLLSLVAGLAIAAVVALL